MTNLKDTYRKEVIPSLIEKLAIKNPMAVPTLSKIVVNMGVKDAVLDKKNVERAVEVLTAVTGQKPKITRAKKSIAAFKLREGDQIGAMVTLRGKRMYDFLSKLINVVLPRLRDFRGVGARSFDGRGNYTLGLAEFSVFPEIDPGKIDKVQGLEIVIATKAKNNEEGRALLEALGVPFQKG